MLKSLSRFTQLKHLTSSSKLLKSGAPILNLKNFNDLPDAPSRGLELAYLFALQGCLLELDVLKSS